MTRLRIPRPPRLPEKAEQARIVQLLRAMGAAVYVLGHPSPSDGRQFRGTGQTPGIPDLCCFLPRRGTMRLQLWIEVKAAGGRLRPAQADFQALCREAGQAHLVGGLDAVLAWLAGAGYRP